MKKVLAIAISIISSGNLKAQEIIKVISEVVKLIGIEILVFIIFKE